MRLPGFRPPRLTRHCLRLILPLLLVCAQAQAQPRAIEEGAHYQPLAEALPTITDADHIEVHEFFWYGCARCAGLEPMTSAWRDGTTGDLVFRRTPAIWNEIMETHARIYFTARALGIEDAIHRAAFRAIHEDGNALSSRQAIGRLFAGQDLPAPAFDEAWDSAEVAEAVEEARALTSAGAIDSLPALLVNGRYLVGYNAQVRERDDLIITVNLLIRDQRRIRRVD